MDMVSSTKLLYVKTPEVTLLPLYRAIRTSALLTNVSKIITLGKFPHFALVRKTICRTPTS